MIVVIYRERCAAGSPLDPLVPPDEWKTIANLPRNRVCKVRNVLIRSSHAEPEFGPSLGERSVPER